MFNLVTSNAVEPTTVALDSLAADHAVTDIFKAGQDLDTESAHIFTLSLSLQLEHDSASSIVDLHILEPIVTLAGTASIIVDEERYDTKDQSTKQEPPAGTTQFEHDYELVMDDYGTADGAGSEERHFMVRNDSCAGLQESMIPFGKDGLHILTNEKVDGGEDDNR